MVGLQPDVSTFCLPDISYMTLLHMMSDETFQHLPLSYAYRQRMSANKLCVYDHALYHWNHCRGNGISFSSYFLSLVLLQTAHSLTICFFHPSAEVTHRGSLGEHRQEYVEHSWVHLDL